MRVRALVALAIAWVLVAAAPAARAGERQEGAEDRPGAGPADAEPVHRPGRGGLPRLVDQLRPARQLQPEGPQPGARHRQELDDLAGQEDDHLQAVRRATSGPTGSRSPRRTSSTASRRSRPTACCSAATSRTSARSTRRTDLTVDHPHQAPGRADRRRPVRLHPARAHLGQGAGQEAHRLLPADAAAGRQRPLHRLRSSSTGGIIRMTRNPNFTRQEAGLRRGPVDQVRQQRRRRPRAHARRDRHHPRGRAERATRGSARRRTSRRSARPSPSVHAARVQPLPRRRSARTRSSTRRSRTSPCARRSPTRSTASGSTRSARAAPRSRATACCPTSTRPSTRKPAQDYPLDVAKANQMLDAAGWKKGSDGIRAKGGQKLSFDLFVRSESRQNIQYARLVREMTKPIGVDFKVQIVSVDKLTEITTRKVKGKMAPGLRHVHLGLGRRPVRPGPAAQPADHEGDRRLVGLVLLQPRVRQALRPADRRVRPGQAQGDRRADDRAHASATCPYIVLTVDPTLQAYRTDKLAGVDAVVPGARPATSPATRSATRRSLAMSRRRPGRRRRQQRRRLERADDRADRGRARRS